MSGHSKWSQIRRQKGINDVKKGQIYTKIAKKIVLASKQGGGDPGINFTLRMAINQGKSVNMPIDNIEKAIKKGMGEDKNSSMIENITYEAYGYGGLTMLIDSLTDNRNRSAADIRMIVEKNGGRMVEAGAISWQYDTFGLISMRTENEDERKKRINLKWNEKVEIRRLENKESVIDNFEINIIGLDGVEDFVYEKDDGIYIISIFTIVERLDEIRKKIEELGFDTEVVEIIKKSKNEIIQTDEDLEKNTKLIELLEANEDVDNIWTNTKES